MYLFNLIYEVKCWAVVNAVRISKLGKCCWQMLMGYQLVSLCQHWWSLAISSRTT